MTDAPELEKLFDPIRQAMADMEARALRFSYIEATIRVNAMRHGATDAQIEDFIAGRADFIKWLAEKVERPDPRVTALVEAAEALDRAVSEVTRYGAQTGSQWTRLSIASLKFRAALAAFKEKTND